MNKELMPNTINYCWFGPKKMGESEIKCIESWKRFFPGYEIKKWDEHNFDIFGSQYSQEAYEEKKYAFVSDYARFMILYENGGIYFDTDVEVIQDMNDILRDGPFLALESDDPPLIAPGLGMAAQKGNLFCAKMIAQYKNRHFRKSDGTLDLSTIVEATTKEALNEGFCWGGKDKSIFKDFVVYSKTFFAPMDYQTGKITISKDTKTIHHYSASWKGPYARWYQQHTGAFFANHKGVVLRTFFRIFFYVFHPIKTTKYLRERQG